MNIATALAFPISIALLISILHQTLTCAAVFETNHGVMPSFPPACSGPSNPQIMEPGRIPPQMLHAGVSGS
jgi:hypothetical protein